jgi:hypothetical protein
MFASTAVHRTSTASSSSPANHQGIVRFVVGFSVSTGRAAPIL